MSDNEQESGPPNNLLLSGNPLSIAQVHAVAHRRLPVELTDDPTVLQRLQSSQSLVRRAVEEDWRVYGVTTGFGGMANVGVPGELAAASQHNLLSFLAAGAGRAIDPRHVRAAMVLRANMLLRGYSGIGISLIRRLVQFLSADAVPVVLELGSIGASGDLIPLAAIARAITGQGGPCRVDWRGCEVDGRDVLEQLGLAPLELAPKEALALINGTSVSSGVAANCAHECRNLLGLAVEAQAMMVRALCGHDDPFMPFVHECKPHPGQVWTASIMRRILSEGTSATDSQTESNHVQDRYSLRCLPQYLGPIVEGLSRISHVVSIEMNAITDNPLVDVEKQRFYQGGNFLGQYIGMAMDDLRRCLGLLAKHLDVQIAQLVSPEFNRGLPASLQGNKDVCYNMGLKGLQITGNSIMPLLTYYGNPLVEHFPTHAEQYNQNVNGLSYGSANLAWQSVELFQQYAAIALIFGVQALDLRSKIQNDHFDGRSLLGTLSEPLYRAVYEVLESAPGRQRPLIFNDADQLLEKQVADLTSNIRGQGSVVTAIRPVLESFDSADLGC